MSTVNPSGVFLQAVPKRTNVRPADAASIEKLLRRRARGRDRQSRYATNCDIRREPSTARIGAGLLKAIATVPPKEFHTIRPVLFLLLQTMTSAGYDPVLVLRKVKLIRRRLRRASN